MYLAEMGHAQAEPQTQSPDKGDKPTKAFSCLRCFERKVKCDKNHPCNNCVKSNVECHFRIPSAPRRKKKKRGTEEILLDRLKRAEDLLRARGIKVDPPQEPISPSSAHENLGPLLQQTTLSTTSPERSVSSLSSPKQKTEPDLVSPFCAKTRFSDAKLIVDESGERSRFIDNNLWSSVSGEFRDPQDAIADESSGEDETETVAEEDNTEFLLGLTPSSSAVSHLHPDQEGMFKLWTLFLDNVNPMTKIIHYPSLQEKLVQASQNIEHVSRGLEALMFAVYLCAIHSIDDAECEKTFKESRKVLLARFRQGAKRSLSRARFLGTADMSVLQAFTLYLLMMREDYDARTLWTLAGVAGRIAQGMGIHRDGVMLGLPPFETEMRRRLWWQILMLDFRSAELSGSGRFGDFSQSDTKLPTNCNDQDLWPGMVEPPVTQVQPTEMLTCLLRCEFGSFWKEKLSQRGLGAGVHPKDFFSTEKMGNWETSMEQRDRLIDELEQRLHDKFLKYCDPTVPLQLMASFIGKGAPTSMRVMAHHPRRWASESDIPQTEREILWYNAVRMIQGDNSVHGNRVLKKFLWHTRVYFQWHALIYLLGELRNHTRGEQVDAAWREVDQCFENHPEFITDYRKPLHVAVGSLCVKAYEARETGLAQEYEERKAQGVFGLPPSTPGYVEMLRQQRSAPRRKDSKNPPAPGLTTTNSNATTVSTEMVTPPNPGVGYNQFQQNIGYPPTEMPMAWTRFDASSSNDFAYDPIMMNYDPNMMVTDMPGNDVQMDWNQWDYLIQEFEVPSAGARPGMGM